MIKDQEYNGWTNYETWLVNLEVFDENRIDFEDQVVEPEYLKARAEEMVLGESVLSAGTAASFAYRFLQGVNWQEIADHINEDNVVLHYQKRKSQ